MNLAREKLKCLNDHEYYANQYLRIITDKEELVPLRLNSIQKKLHFVAEHIMRPPDERPKEWYDMLAPYNSMDTLLRAHTNIRANVLKARREGLSTYIASRGFKRFHLRPNVKGLTVAHNGESCSTIFRMSKVYYDQLPADFKPTQKHNNGNTLELLKTYSLWQIQKASEVDTSRSKGASFVHCSELAFWSNATDAMVSLKQTMNDEAEGTEWWNETTPNGEGGMGAYFYDQWKDTKNGDNDYINIFFRWFDYDVYSKAFVNVQVEKAEFINSVLSHKEVEKYGEEEKIKALYNLSWEQMNWRRHYIRNKTEGLNKFMQEYPEDDESCFLTTGNTFFSVPVINHIKSKCKEPERGDLVWTNETKTQVRFVPSKQGFSRVWQRPDGLHYENRYAMGWDVSLGVDEGDYTCGEMLDVISGESVNVFEWHGILRSDLVAEELLKVSFWYGNKVWHCIEQQGEGSAVINFIRDRYSYLYTTVQFGKFGEEPTENIGFKTNAKTKGIILPALRLNLESSKIVTQNEEFIDECRSFVKGEVYKDQRIGMGQRVHAENKGRSGKRRRYDDRVLAMALADEMVRMMSPITEDWTKEPAWVRKLKQQNKNHSFMGA